MTSRNLSAYLLLLVSGFLSLPVNATPTDHFIVGHYRNNVLHSPLYEIDDIPAERLTHLIYQNADVTPEGDVVLGHRFLDIQKLYLDLDIEKLPYAGNFAKLAQLKQQYPNLKTLISIGKWGQSQYFLAAAKTAEGRNRLITSAIDFMLMYGFDGMDIYWQPFEDKAVSLEEFQQDRKLFVQFIRELRADLNRRKSNALLTLSMKMPCLMHPWNMEDLAAQIDFVNLHAAYFHGAWEKTTNHISPIYDSPWQFSVDTMFDALAKGGIPATKIVLDIGTYGQAWQGIRNINNGLQQPATSISLGSWDTSSEYTGLYSRYHTQQIIAMPGYQEFWDDKAKASYAFNPNRYQGHFISYESIRSLDAKIDYMKTHQLLGIGVLDLHNEKSNHESLLIHIHRKFYFWAHIRISFKDFFKRYHHDIILFLRIIGLLGCVWISAVVFYRKKKSSLSKHSYRRD